jgi:TonB family protein
MTTTKNYLVLLGMVASMSVYGMRVGAVPLPDWHPAVVEAETAFSSLTYMPAQKASPLTLDQIKELLALLPDAAVAGEIKDRGVNFTVREPVIAELRQGGAGNQTLELLRTMIPPNRPPTLELKSDRPTVKEGGAFALTAEASDPDGDQLKYTWTTSAGKLEGDGASVRLATNGTSVTSDPVVARVSVLVEDGKGGAETKSLDLSIEKANSAPTVSIRAEKNEIKLGEALLLSADGKDPDNDQLQYRWETSTGAIEGTGANVSLNSTNIQLTSNPLPVKITVTVSDGKGASATDSVNVSVLEPPPIIVENIPAVATTKTQPVYPDIARRARVAGRVVVEVTIDEQGNVSQARAIEGNAMLHDAAVTAVKKWKFKPATKNGTPATDVQRVAFDFKP